jgi:hypothetical protein
MGSSLRLASPLMPRFGFLDGRFVIPAATACRFAGAQGAGIDGGLGLLVAMSAEGRTTPGRELVDLCGPVIQTRIHPYLLLAWRFRSCCARLVRDWLLKIDIVAAHGSRNLIK